MDFTCGVERSGTPSRARRGSPFLSSIHYDRDKNPNKDACKSKDPTICSPTIIIALGITLFLPSITAEVQSITVNLQLKHPAVLTDEFKTIIEEKFPLMKQRGLSEDIASYLHSTLDTLIEKSIEILFEFVHIVSMIFTVPIFTFFLLKDGQRIKQSLIQFVPNCYFEMTLSLVHKISRQIGSYIRGRLLDAMIVGILCTITLYLLDVRYAFLIGLLAGCANIIPHFGPIVGAIPAIIVALMETGSFTSVLVITISFVAIQLFDHLFISHMIELKNIHMHSIVVLIVIFIGGYLMGALGMFIGVLLAGIIKVTITEFVWSFKHYRIFGRTPPSSSR